MKLRRERLSVHDSISGWTVGLNSGDAVGQRVLHAHWHLIRGWEEGWKELMGKERGGRILREDSSTLAITWPQ
jgi:ATP adenylyltransferase